MEIDEQYKKFWERATELAKKDNPNPESKKEKEAFWDDRWKHLIGMMEMWHGKNGGLE